MTDTAERLNALLDPATRVDAEVTRSIGRTWLGHAPQVRCADGFHMSVQASDGHYCTPRDNVGPWVSVEVGYPSAKVESFMPHIDGDDRNPTETVYGYVPIALVVEAIDAHGGFAASDTKAVF